MKKVLIKGSGACYSSKKQEGNVNIHLNCYPNRHNKITESHLYRK